MMTPVITWALTLVVLVAYDKVGKVSSGTNEVLEVADILDAPA